MSTRNPDLGDELSDREMRILRGMAEGKTNKEIGRAQYISEDTVKTFARRLFRKLGAIDRANAVWLAVRRGILVAPIIPPPSGQLIRTVPLPQGEWLRRPQGTHPVRCFTSFGCRCAEQTVDGVTKVVGA